MGPPETKDPPVMAVTEGPDSSTGKGLNEKDTTRTADDYARERYRLDGLIKRILRAEAKRTHPHKHAANVYRTVGCTWIRVDDLSLIKPVARESYHYKGLMTCGSVHTCPICASKIQERRRQEVAAAIAHMEASGNACAMVSLTFPHRVDQPLSDLLQRQQLALKKLRESQAYVRLMGECGAVGRIRSLEVTHGKNGWHPHTHELLFLKRGVCPGWLRSRLVVLWFRACSKVGLYRHDRDDEVAFIEHSVDVQVGDNGAAAYIAKMDDQTKWGLSHEVTKGSSKQGRRAGMHPFKLAAQDSTSHLFIEYVNAMKGARQLVWSRGLKAQVGIEEKTDEQIATEQTANVQDQIPIHSEAWRYVVCNDARFELTHAAKHGGAPAVARFLELLGYTHEASKRPNPKPHHHVAMESGSHRGLHRHQESPSMDSQQRSVALPM